jgi:plastocyanin
MGKPVGRAPRKVYSMALMRRVPLLVAALLLLLTVAACGGYGDDNKSEEGEGSTLTIGGVPIEVHGTKDVSGETGKVEVEMYDDFFEPTVLKGTPGQQVELELKNEGENAHTFTISEQSVDAEVQPADETEVNVTFPESGELVFVCRFHENSGMVGALEPAS